MQACLVAVAVAVAACGALPVRVKRGHEHHEHHEHATSYQNFNLESYHPVPVYKKHHGESGETEPRPAFKSPEVDFNFL